MTKDKNCFWRYQVVYDKTIDGLNEDNFAYTICEVYLDDDGKLECWTEGKSIAPYGESIDELNSDLQMMQRDLATWKPVPFDSLSVGMTFERNLGDNSYTEERRELLKDYAMEEVLDELEEMKIRRKSGADVTE